MENLIYRGISLKNSKVTQAGDLSSRVYVVRSASWVQNLDNLGPVVPLHLMKGMTGTGRCGLMHRLVEASASGSHLCRGMGLVGIFSEELKFFFEGKDNVHCC